MERPNQKRRLLQFQDFEIDDGDYRAVNKILKASAGGFTNLADVIAQYNQKKNSKDELATGTTTVAPPGLTPALCLQRGRYRL